MRTAPGECFLLTRFHLVSDTNIVTINFKSNEFYVLYELFVVQNQGYEYYVQCFEDMYVDKLLLSFVPDIFFVHFWINFNKYFD